MKKIGLLLTFVLLSIAFVNAQPGNFDPEEMVKMQVERLTETCSLTSDQVPKVEAIVKKYNEKMMEMFQGGGPGGDFEEMRENMEKMQEEQGKEIKAVLTGEQGKKYDEYLKEQQERMRQMGGGF